MEDFLSSFDDMNCCRETKISNHQRLDINGVCYLKVKHDSSYAPICRVSPIEIVSPSLSMVYPWRTSCAKFSFKFRFSFIRQSSIHFNEPLSSCDGFVCCLYAHSKQTSTLMYGSSHTYKNKTSWF